MNTSDIEKLKQEYKNWNETAKISKDKEFQDYILKEKLKILDKLEQLEK